MSIRTNILCTQAVVKGKAGSGPDDEEAEEEE
jgi:hypothetical protein